MSSRPLFIVLLNLNQTGLPLSVAEPVPIRNLTSAFEKDRLNGIAGYNHP